MKELDNLFINIRNRVYNLIKEKNIDLDLLSFDLKIDTDTFIRNFNTRIDDFNFYFAVLDLVERWDA